MLRHDIRFYLAGTREQAKNATIEIAWYLSGVAIVASVVETNNVNDEVFLNCIGNCDNEEYVVRQLKKVADKYGLQGFTNWRDYRGSDE